MQLLQMKIKSDTKVQLQWLGYFDYEDALDKCDKRKR